MMLLCCGRIDLVREVLRAEEFIEDVSPYALETLSLAYRSLWSQEVPDQPGVSPRVFATERDATDWERARLLVRSRRLLAHADLAGSTAPYKRADGMSAGFAVHAEAIALLEQGRVGECRGLLMMYRPEGIGGTLPDALLTVDSEVTRLLACEETGADLDQVRRSEEFFERCGFAPLVGWGGVLMSIREILYGIEPSPGFESMVAAAERRENGVLAAALCCIAVLADLIRRSAASAHIRAKHAKALAKAAGSGLLDDVATILQAVCGWFLDEEASYRVLLHRSWSTSALGDISACVYAALSESVVAPPESAPKSMESSGVCSRMSEV